LHLFILLVLGGGILALVWAGYFLTTRRKPNATTCSRVNLGLSATRDSNSFNWLLL